MAHLRYEIYTFSSGENHESFVNHIFPRNTEPLVGAVLTDGPVPVPASAVLLANAKAPELRRRFVFSSALLSQTRHRRLTGGPPPWLMLGVAHFMEQRLKKGRSRYDEAGILPGKDKVPGDWDQAVRDQVLARRAADVTSLTSAGLESLTPQLRIQSQSMARFLAGVGTDRFGRFVGMLYRTAADRPRALRLADAIKAVYEVDTATLDRAWRSWAGRRKGT